MKKIIILPIACVIIGVLGLAIIFIPTEITVTLLGSVIMTAGVLGFIAYLMDKEAPSKHD